MTPKI